VTCNPELLARLTIYAIAFAPGFISIGVPEVPAALAGIGLGLVAARLADAWACDAECRERRQRKRRDELARMVDKRA
jgi:hypothetical protein